MSVLRAGLKQGWLHFGLVWAITMPASVGAQSLLPMPRDGAVSEDGAMVTGGGWQQFDRLGEMQAFGIDVVLTLALAALITFHPTRRAARTAPRDFTMPRLFMLYSLIGMAVGFLVIQHGYIIGFVIFGIGALLRFRSNLDDPVDTVEMILVTVLGLSVGLGLPVMAILIGLLSWILIWMTGRRFPLEIRLQAEDDMALDTGLKSLTDLARTRGWKLGHAHRAHSKHSARVVMLVKAADGVERTEDALAESLSGMPVTWKVST